MNNLVFSCTCSYQNIKHVVYFDNCLVGMYCNTHYPR